MNLDLMVCPCKQVTLGDLLKAVKDGATTFAEVQEVTGVSTVCRGCKNKAQAMTENLIDEVKNGTL
ncbi:MAG: (2Fe-2S)-binding protein [Lachnospirales bacterium]